MELVCYNPFLLVDLWIEYSKLLKENFPDFNTTTPVIKKNKCIEEIINNSTKII
jgi:hypothetical protein